MTAEALSSWQAPKRTTRGGQPRYSDLAIEIALTLDLVFGLRLRQTEGLLTSVLLLMGADLAVPDHTRLSRRARTRRSFDRRQGRCVSAEGPIHVLIDSTGLEVYGAGQWLEEKHGARSRRGWRKLHLAMDTDDASQVGPLLDQIDAPFGQFTADGAYDGKPTHDVVTRHCVGATVTIPPRSNAVDRSATETAIGRNKSIIGRRLRARSFGAQQTEVAVGSAFLNRMFASARPNSIRCKKATA